MGQPKAALVLSFQAPQPLPTLTTLGETSLALPRMARRFRSLQKDEREANRHNGGRNHDGRWNRRGRRRRLVVSRDAKQAATGRGTARQNGRNEIDR